MSINNVFGNIYYYGSFLWVYGVNSDLWNAASRSYQKNIISLQKPHLITLIDYRIPSNKPRLWTFKLFPLMMPTLVCHTRVAHGTGSGKGSMVEKVSSVVGSNMSCVGGFVTKHIYQSALGQKDKTKKRPALWIDGLDPTNKNASYRGIRMHGAHYVKDVSVGRSHGCICCKQEIHEELIQVIAGGSFIFSYFGEDSIKV